MDCNPNLNAVGFTFEFTILDCDNQQPLPLNLSTTRVIYFKKPDGQVIFRDGEFKTDGSDSIITYTTIAGDLDQPRLWHVQYLVDIPDFNSGTNIETFIVSDNIY